MKILVTGVNGFLGHYLTAQLLAKKYTVIATGLGACRLPFEGQENFFYETMDFTDDARVQAVFHKHKPDVVVHAGALCKPDDCELQQELAYKINADGTVILLEQASKCNSSFIYVSTDFIFDGEKGMYAEDDIPNPVNYYGTTKWEAEKAVQQFAGNWAIARTVLVYGKPLAGRSNILTVVKEKLEKGEEYKVVSDQVRTPTYVEDLAAGIVLMVEKKVTGIFHLSGADILTPFDMACKTADHLDLNRSLLINVTAATFSQPAQRPLKTGFIIDKAKKELGFSPIPFEEGLIKTFS
ncbi:MAG: SDR family oxidoreductase [Chitinophagaceae bacterium]